MFGVPSSNLDAEKWLKTVVAAEAKPKTQLHLNLAKLFINNVDLRTFQKVPGNMKDESNKKEMLALLSQYKLMDVTLGLPIVTEFTDDEATKSNFVELLYR